ncbi:MFS transporter [Salisediminibacterium selenitireducens]|uniref:Major facilitator superfamily MFS_1 n=1 Tax=Bacillus selenitireducens (strain ATCC 700615 / DSM 15326 / MLS10) TaxID=439292 RepID=D6XUC2_BACIE|nr:MFS transporter [Salisediminibacterium selenitireducens]ADH99408.1 major facilitator superfamily MFS_1 [[Bacillus] selenitireducens MLS10]
MTKVLYFMIMVAFLDTFVQLPIITPYAVSLGASNVLTGAIIAVYSLANMVGNIFTGHWIDRFGRKKMLLISMFLVAFILLFYPLAQNGAQLFLIRLLHGLAGGALIPAAFAYVGDRTRREGRGRAMAYTGGSIGFAAIIGPAFGGGVAAAGEIEWVFILISIIFVLTAVLVITNVEESFTPVERAKVKISDFSQLLKEPLIIQASLTAFALMISNGTLAFALPLKIDSIGLDSASTGMLLSIYGLTALLVFLTPVNRLFDSINPVHLILSGLILIGSSMMMLTLFDAFALIILAMIVYGSGFAFVFPSMNKVVSDASSKVDRGKAYGIFYAAFSLGVVSGSFIAGAVAEWFGLPFFFAASMIWILSGVLYAIYVRHLKSNRSKNERILR